MNRLLIILYTLDSFILSLLTAGNMRLGETISSVAYSLESDGKWLGRILRPSIDTILWWDKDHCYEAWLTFKRITGQNR